jgi:hypothetical protein
MRKIWRRILAKLFIEDGFYYVYRVHPSGRETYEGIASYEYSDRGFGYIEYSISQRKAYIKGKIKLDGKIKYKQA